MFTSHLRVLDSDEAVVGLIARDALDGRFTAFFWYQAYGGVLEALLAAPLLLVQPTTVIGLKLVPVVLTGVAAVALWRLATRALPAGPALLAGALAWCWCGAFVWWSTKARGFYAAQLACSVGLALAVVRIVEQPRDWRRWAVAGVVAGIGWWQSPQLVFVAAPLGAWMLLLVARRRLPLPPAGLAAFVAGTLAGGFPWFAFVARNGLLPLRAENAYGDGDGYVEHLVTFLREGAPMAFGARVVYEGRWVGGTTVGVAVAVVVGALVAVGVGRLLGTGLQQPAAIGGLVVLAYPLLLAAFPNGGYVGEGRYLFFLGPWLAFAVAALVPPSRVAAGGVAVAGCVALAAAGLAAPTPGLTSPYTNGAAVVPLHVSPVIEVLRDLGVRNVFTDYWIAMRLRYESDDDVLAASNLVFRDLQAQIDVDADPDAAWVVVAGSRDEARVRCAATRLGLTATETPAAPFTVIRTDRPLRPGDVTPCPDEG